MQFNSIKYVPKIEPDSLELLSLIYTPGVGEACMKIKENDGLSYMYTNRENSVAVISFDYEKSLKHAIFLKSTLNIDAYPFEVEQSALKLVVENIYPNFCGFDLTLISDEVKDIEFNVDIPVLKQSGLDIMDFFKPFSKNIFMFSLDKLEGTFQEQALALREKAGGVIESELSDEPNTKPVAIISDGSAVLGFGNIGAEAAIPVMEGKAVLFSSLGAVSAISLCVKTQNPDEIIEIATALKNSFAGINLEDISAPRCFDIEKALVDILDIPVFHDDQHGTAIVVLAALINGLSVADKKIDEIKIVVAGAGAAAQAVSKLILKAGAKNIIHTDSKGIVYLGREINNAHLEEFSKLTNLDKMQGTLSDAIVGADVFIGLSTANVLKKSDVEKMAEKPIVFALSNPTPEIMPDVAKEGGAFIVATGRSDFDNQINNSLAFPGLFRGILDNGIKKITDEIKLECAFAIASLIKDDELSQTNIIPNALDPRVVYLIKNRLENFK